MKVVQTLLLTLGLLVVSQAKAGFITVDENALDGIFSQANFGNRPIDIRIGTATELVFPDLLDITNSDEVTTLFSQHVGAFNLVNFYFVDTISACGSSNSANIIGCGEYFGNDFVVESIYAAGRYNGELLAHELGHNLGLPHTSNGLMFSFINNNTTLTTGEVDAIHESYLVQNNGLTTNTEYWININPVLIVAAASTPVPEPSTLVLLLLSVGLLVRKNSQK